MIPDKFAGWLTINRSCNLRCQWCYAQILDFNEDFNMSLDMVKAALKVFGGLNLQNVIIIGGEPTCHPQLLEIIDLIYKARLNPLLVTNSLRFFDKNYLDQAIANGLYGITTSLKAGSDIAYKIATGVPAFTKVMAAIKNISATNVYHKISVTVCESLFDQFDEILEAISASGSKFFSLDMERPIILRDKVVSPGNASPQQMADFFMQIYPKLVNVGIRFTIKFSLPFCLFDKGFIDTLISQDQIISGCQIFNGKGIIIDSLGRLLPCNHFCDNALGKMGIDFSDSTSYIEFRKRDDIKRFYAKISGYPAKVCSRCSYWIYCGGGCRVHWFYRGENELLGRGLERSFLWTH